MPKQYTLISSEPLTEFDESILRMLHDVAETGCTPKSMVGAILTDSGEVVTYYHNATMADMMVCKGFLELDIQNDNILGNLPWFVEQARKEGLLGNEEVWEEEEEYEEEEECEDGEEDS